MDRVEGGDPCDLRHIVPLLAVPLAARRSLHLEEARERMDSLGGAATTV